MNITDLLAFGAANGVSDFHLSAGVEPMVRVSGDMRRIDIPPLDHAQVRDMIYDVMNDKQRKEYEKYLECDFSFSIPGVARFRVNAYVQHRGAGAVLRTIPSKILSLEQLGAPPLFKKFAMTHKGIVTVTGGTGSGKSTTLAAMMNYRNETEYGHILTIEDPVEFVHECKNCLMSQREVKTTTLSFDNALKSALRQDPNVILVGELRDLETIRLALSASETGHVVFGTLHTASAAKTIDRIVEVFPTAEKSTIRTMVSESIQAIVAQSLLKKIGGGRIAAHEILVGTPAIRNLIRENKVAQMYSSMQTGQKFGMQTLDGELEKLVKKRIVTKEHAREYAVNKDKFV
ncbi:MAG: type IV pilus twitching motility protein PilT [Proteobacteria bacterium]|nr:type IV pilus twitching motility protein PilT [Pseudomonadota bacterium]